MQLQAREKRFLIVGSAIIVLLLAYLLWPSSSAPRSSVELTTADQRSAAGPPSPLMAPPPPAPIPVQTVVAPPPTPGAAVVAAGPGGIPIGLTLTGIAGRGAIFGAADGSQRYVPQGREIAPGVVLQAISTRYVLLAAGATNYRMSFGGLPVAVGAPASVALSGPQSAANAPPAEQSRLAGLRAESAQLQSGLSPRQVGNRISGYYVRSVSYPALQRAGVQPGDIILSVNGSELGPEALGELPGVIQNSSRVEFEVERGGQRIRVAIPPGR